MFAHIRVYFGRFRHIQNRRQIQPVLRTLLRYYSNAINTASEPYLGRFMHIRILPYLGTQSFTHILAYLQSYTYRGIFVHIRTYFSIFRHIQGPGINGSNNVNQHLLFKSVSSFKSLFKNLFGTFFHFCVKSKHSIFFLQILLQ